MKIFANTLTLAMAVLVGGLALLACAADRAAEASPPAPAALAAEVPPEVPPEPTPGPTPATTPVPPAQPVAEALEPTPPAAAAGPAPGPVEEPPALPAVRLLGRLTELDNAPSRRRLLSAPQPWDGEPARPYRLAEDREAARAASLAQRASLRAFEGAPPVMPHSESFTAGSKTCLDCHTSGMAIGERVAHPMSHAPMANCSQCHVERDGAPFGHVLELPESDFEGFRPERRGLSSIAGAPPLMPHGTDMRTRCLSCHGEFGYPGLRTSHPRRANCTQCHTTPGAR